MRKLTLLAIAATLAILLLYWLAQPSPPASQPVAAIATTAENTETATETANTPVTTATPVAARTVAILDIPVSLDASGNLVTDTRVRQLFDLFATANADEPVDRWKDQILQPYANQLPAAAQPQLQELFNRYVEFNLALQLLPMEGAPNLAAVLQRVQQLRQRYLGNETAQLMYADWSALEDFTRQYLHIMATTTDPQAARAQLQSLAQQLPHTVQQRAQGIIGPEGGEFAVPDDVRSNPAAYTRALEEQAAVAMIETTLTFDEPSAEFMARFQQYSEEKKTVLLSDASPDQQQKQLQTLRARHFSGADILRVETLDRAEAF